MTTDLTFQAMDGQNQSKVTAFAVQEVAQQQPKVQIEITAYSTSNDMRRSLRAQLSREQARAMGHALLALAECSPIGV